MIKILLLTVLLIGLAFAGIAIKMFLKKGGQFEKQCSSTHLKTGDRMACSCGHGEGGPDCRNKKQDS